MILTLYCLPCMFSDFGAIIFFHVFLLVLLSLYDYIPSCLVSFFTVLIRI